MKQFLFITKYIGNSNIISAFFFSLKSSANVIFDSPRSSAYSTKALVLNHTINTILTKDAGIRMFSNILIRRYMGLLALNFFLSWFKK